jgi:flagellar motor switch protein FliN/FliY
MTNKDYLSQEEIDALLRQSSDGPGSSPSKGATVDDYLNPIEQDALGEIGNITFGSAATALSTLLGKKVDITTPLVSIIARSELENEFPQPHVAIHVKYVEGFDGINLLVIKTRDARVIADLMMGGTGDVPADAELTELHISAVQEAMNQMMGSSATSMSTIFNRFVNISPPGINILDLQSGDGKEQLPHEDVFVKVSFRLIIGELIDSTLMQLLPVSFAKEMVSILMGGTSASSESAYANEPVLDERPAPSAHESAPAPTPQPDPMAGYGHQAPPNIPAPEYDPYAQQPPMAPPHAYPPPSHMQQPQGPAHYGGLPGRNVNVQPAQFSSFPTGPSVLADDTNLNLLLDIPLKVTVELGRTKKLIKEILEFSQGSIIELDKLAGEPVDILVNNKLIAKGEVVVIDENFGVRVTDIISQVDRIQKLQ